MKRLLMIAYYFPPLGGIGSLRATAFATDLADYGWEASVLAPRNAAYFRDEGLTFPEDRIIRTSSLELSRAGKRLLATGGDDTSPADVSGARGLVRRLARQCIYFPDAQVGWYLPAVLTAQRRIRDGDFDAIFSTSFPLTSHLIARRLHRRLGIPWIAEFRDPWSPRLPHHTLRQKRAFKLERAFAHDASALVTVSPSWGEMLAEAWQRDVLVIPNGHGGSRHIADPDSTTGPFTVGYLGTYYPATQDLGAVWQAIAALDQNGNEAVDRILLIGDSNPAFTDSLRPFGLEERLVCTGFLPQDAATAELSHCTALLVAGPTGGGLLERGVIAAKIFEYLASGRPIIYIGDPEADAARLLARVPGTYIVRPGDADAAEMALEAARKDTIGHRPNEFDRHALAGRLAAVLNDVTAGRESPT